MNEAPTVVFNVAGTSCTFAYDNARIFAEQLRGHYAEQYQQDVVRLGGDSGWLHGCESLANQIEAVLTTAEPGPVTIDPRSLEGDAAFHVLRLVTPSFDATNPRHCLFRALDAARGKPPSPGPH